MKRVSTQMEHKTAPVYELEMESEKSLRSPESRTYPLSLIDNSYILETKLFDKSEQVKLLIELEGIGSGGDGYYPPILRHEQISDENFESSLNQPDEQQKIRSSASSAQYTNFAASGPSSGENNCQLQSRALQNYVDIPDTVVPPRAEAVLPSILQIRRGIIAPRRALPACARFGPVQGIRNTITMQEAESLKLQAYSSKTPLFLLRDDNNIILIDVTDKDKSNWIGLLPLGDEESANIWIYEENKALYAVTTDTVLSRKPLKLGYSKKYAQNYGLTGPTKDIEAVPPVEKKAWWCKECQRSMPSSYLLQRHMDMYHKEDSQVPRRKYRCRQCTKTFCRLFTLRRHMARHCTKKVVNSENENKILNVDTETQASLNAMLNSEDNRIPSDESFQNFSNGLDFSTNLFDTDRIPSLDISVRSEGEFNPYAIGYKDDNNLANVLDVPQNGYDEAMQKKCEQILVTCPYCNQVVVKEKKRQHVSECSARRYECECKKVFTSKRLLSNHIYTQHSNEGKYEHAKEDVTTTKSVDGQDIIVTQPLQCDQCQRVFKRRGMLVNHLWQVHKTVSSAPLERRIRHYPCVACPVIYRTAAKRDRHVKMRHPEATLVRGLSLEGGTRLLPAAACGACPRQYATRAKLLQHQRQRHPHLVQPARKTKKNGNGSKNSVNQVQPDTLADFNYSC